MKNKCIVNVAIGPNDSWYHRGSKRLLQSVSNEDCDFIFTHNTQTVLTPYLDKIISIIDAANAGYKRILYLDCSLTAMKSLDEIWSYIENDGYYLSESGYNCAQTSSDKVLNHFGVNRDTVEKWKEVGTCIVGLNMDHWFGQKMIKELQMHYIPECVNTIKWPNEQQRLQDSTDQRFLFNRQDQTVISLIAGKYNIKLHPNDLVWRDEVGYTKNNKHIFRLKGGE